MGCVGSSDSEPVSKKKSLDIQIKKLRLQLQQKREKIVAEATVQQKGLIEEFNKPKNVRTKLSEEAIVQQIVQKIDIITVYQITRQYVDKVISHWHFLNKKTQAKQTIHPSFRMLLYLQQILNDQNLNRICRLIHQYDSSIMEQKQQNIQDEMIKRLKNNQRPTNKMLSDYILKLCNQQSLNLEQINQVGHTYKYEI